MDKEKKQLKVLIISDDYDEDLRKEGLYQKQINSCFDKKIFNLTIKEEYPISTNLHYYDFVLLDFGMVGNLTMSQMKELSKVKELTIISALGSEYIEQDEWYKKHFADRKITDFRIEYIGLFLETKMKGGK